MVIFLLEGSICIESWTSDINSLLDIFPRHYRKGQHKCTPIFAWPMIEIFVQPEIHPFITHKQYKLLFVYSRKWLRKHNPNPPLYTRYQNNFTADLKLLPLSSCPKCDVTCRGRKPSELSLQSCFCLVFPCSQQCSIPVVNLTEQDKAFLPNEASSKEKNKFLHKNVPLSQFFPQK